ncbi:MAG: hypothetical protein ACOC4M_12530 [Promethearchaeia archaeon]
MAVHKAQLISGIIFLIVGISSLLYYDYGIISFLFAFPQFFATGLFPLLCGLLILFRGILEAEKIKFSKLDDKLHIHANRIIPLKSFEPVEIDYESIHYSSLKYRETRTKRWLITFILILLTIEVHYQNAVDLFGHARIAPMLVLWPVMLGCGILIFIFTPKRWLEIADNKETLTIPYTKVSKEKREKILEILNVNIKQQEKNGVNQIMVNIQAQLMDFILGIFLLIFGCILLVSPIFYFGSFTRAITFTYGFKLMVRVINGDPFFTLNKAMEDKSFYLGCSPKFTYFYLITKSFRKIDKRTLSPLRFHLFEIFGDHIFDLSSNLLWL